MRTPARRRRARSRKSSMSPMPTRRVGHRRSASRTQRSGPMPAGSPRVTAMGAFAFIARESTESQLKINRGSAQRLDVDARRVAEDLHLDVRCCAYPRVCLADSGRNPCLREAVERLRRCAEYPERVERPGGVDLAGVLHDRSERERVTLATENREPVGCCAIADHLSTRDTLPAR